MDDAELLSKLDLLRATMISVSTGGSRIDEVNSDFQETFRQVGAALDQRRIENTLPYNDLWQWYGKWSSELSGWASRRAYVANLFAPLISKVRSHNVIEAEPTGWKRVDRTLIDARENLMRAKNEEHFQTIGLLCREALITLAQEVFDPAKHPTEQGLKVSDTDFKRLIEAYIAVEMRGGAAEELRKHSRTALDLALRLQHQRTAAFRDAAICIEATSAVVNIIAIVSGRRDPAN
jgi:hypothetical protein